MAGTCWWVARRLQDAEAECARLRRENYVLRLKLAAAGHPDEDFHLYGPPGEEFVSGPDGRLFRWAPLSWWDRVRAFFGYPHAQALQEVRGCATDVTN